MFTTYDKGDASTQEQNLQYLVEKPLALKQSVETSVSQTMDVAGIEEARRALRSVDATLTAVYFLFSFIAIVFDIKFVDSGQGSLSK